MLDRRTLLKAVAATGLGSAAMATPAIAQRGPRTTLRFVPQADLASIDPTLSSTAVALNHGYYVFDTLFAVDGKSQPRPQMAESYTVSDDGRTCLIRLRNGLKFHDGEPVLARDCVASLMRWSKRDAFAQTIAPSIEAFEAADDRTIRIRMTRPVPRLIDALAKPSVTVPFIYPERFARVDASTAITEAIGSGPFRYVANERVPGSLVVYEKFAGYVPRQEPPDWASGGKVAHFDRVEWQVIPDAATAAAALQTGEVDWWELAQSDLVPMLKRNIDVRTTVVNPTGIFAVMRFNCLTPPFNNAALRRALLGAIDQTDYMQAVAGDSSNWRTCYSLFPCTLPTGNEAFGGALRGPRDLGATKAAIAKAGYNGEKFVLLNPTDMVTINPLGEVSAELFRKLGMNVDMYATDWGTVSQRVLSQEPMEKGGWNVTHTWASGATLANPVVNQFLRAQGRKGFLGWYGSEQMEAYAAEWLNATTNAAKDQALSGMQQLGFEDAPTIPLGQFFLTSAYRKDLTGILQSIVPHPWNVRRSA